MDNDPSLMPGELADWLGGALATMAEHGCVMFGPPGDVKLRAVVRHLRSLPPPPPPDEPDFSQAACIGQSVSKWGWTDYEEACMGTYGGGYHTEPERKIFQHGMATVFNMLRAEFLPAEQCRKVKTPPADAEAVRLAESLEWHSKTQVSRAIRSALCDAAATICRLAGTGGTT